MRASTTFLVAVLALAALAARANAAETGAPGAWSVAGSGMRSISGQIATARTRDGVLHVIWSRGGAGTPWALFDTEISPGGDVSAPKVVASGWSRIDDPAGVARNQSLTVVFPGTKTDKTGDPTEGLDSAGRSGGPWSVGASAIYGTDFGGSSVPSLAQVTSGALLQAWPANGVVVVHPGIDPAVAAVRGFGSGGNVALTTEGSSAWVAWCASSSTKGVFVRGVAPISGAPVGAALRMPGSESTRCPAATRTQLVARAGGGVYAAASTSSERTVRVWRAGSSSTMTVAADSGIKQQIALAAAPDGRLWIGWRDADSGHLLFRRSNRTATVWGAVVSTAVPASQDGGVYNLDLASQADRVDVLARTTRGSSAVSLFHTQMLPGLSLQAADDHGHVTVLVTDAGDPVAGAIVGIGGHELKTGGNGSAGLDLAAGTYTVEAAKAGYVGATGGIRVSS